MRKHYCINVENILRLERNIIEDHIAEHKWCNGISDKEKAVADFVNKFAWLMREIYCGSMCPYRNKCKINTKYRNEFLRPLTKKDFQEYVSFAYGKEDPKLIEIKIRIIKQNVDIHKYLNKIDRYEEAIKDFLNKFGWLIFEMYKLSKKEQ